MKPDRASSAGDYQIADGVMLNIADRQIGMQRIGEDLPRRGGGGDFALNRRYALVSSSP